MEPNPSAVFYETEVKRRCGSGFAEAVKSAFLVHVQPQPRRETLRPEPGKTASVVEWDGKLYALDDDDPEADPIPVSPKDVARRCLSLEAVARRFHSANDLHGDPSALTDRMYYVGYAEQDAQPTALVLGLFAGEGQAIESALSLPSRLSQTHSRFVLACPSLTLRSQDHARRFEDLGIRLCQLDPKDVWRIRWPAQAAPLATRRGEPVLVIEEEGRVVTYAGEAVPLTPTEHRVLVALARRPGRPVAVGNLGRAGWPPDGQTDLANVKTIISQLRRRLNPLARSASAVELGLPKDVIDTAKGRFDDATTYALALKEYQVSLPATTP